MHRKPGDPAPADPLEERFLAFGRVFSGVLRQVRADLMLTAAHPSQSTEQRTNCLGGKVNMRAAPVAAML